MAKNGSFNTTDYSDRYLVFSWSEKVQTYESNYTVINWSLTGAGGTSTRYYYSGPFSVTIDGEEVYHSTTRIQLFNGTVVASGEKVITHNADGKRSFTASAKGAIYDGSYNVSGSGSWDLDAIPRQATLTTAPNFNDEENPTITYSNLAGNAVSSLQACISLNGNDADVPYRDISKTGTSYTFNLTEAERNTLRNATSTADSRTVYFFIRTGIGDKTYYSSKGVTLSIINATPQFTVSYEDTNQNTVALTGNNQNMVRYYSNMKVTVTPQLAKGATLKSLDIECGSRKLSSNGIINGVDGNTLYVSLTDSRNKTFTTATKINLLGYVYPTINYNKTNLSMDGQVTINLNGNAYRDTFGKVNNDTELQYCYSENGGAYTNWVNFYFSNSSTRTYTATLNITGLNYSSGYKFKIRLADMLNEVITTPFDIVSNPIFEWGRDTFQVNADYAKGHIYGLAMLDKIPDNSDLNDPKYREPGVYGIASHATAKTITNIPAPMAGRLIVYSALGGNYNKGTWNYINQEYHPLDGNQPIYKRVISTDATEGNWHYGRWCRDRGEEVLWSGGDYMAAGSKIVLPNLISNQPNGIVLRFCYWDEKTPSYSDISEFFVPKDFATRYAGKSHTFTMATGQFSVIGTKHIYIKEADNEAIISGYVYNTQAGTSNGITYNNAKFCLFEVIGV